MSSVRAVPAAPARRTLLRNPASWYVAALILVWPVEALLSPGRLNRLQDWSSANLANLHPWPAGHPVEALVVSAFVPQDSAWVWPLFALATFTVVSLLGPRRAVVALALVHVGVTALTEALVWWRIRHDGLPAVAAQQLDTGPSYLVVTAMTVALCRARPVWLRAGWLVLLALALPDLLDGIGEGDCSAVGHLLAFAAGLALSGVLAYADRRRRGREGDP
ncbi:rhomboid-like protein [Kitasatospora sp. NPDC008050]|uniref:rhomboid-like protein n=1 Tax=Kitasatospora sp. NPDC008050 TaxID=3364021 RepID=UPI0036DFC920